MRLKPLSACLAVCLALLLPPLPHAREDDVIRIGSFEELCAFSEGVARGELAKANACLTADIVAARLPRPIGTGRHLFSGEFDGLGHTVSRLVVVGPSGSQGLFGYVGPEGVVKNVVLRGACVVGATYTGSIAGYSAGRIEGCRAEGCRVVSLGRGQYGAAAGGVAGLASGRVSGCAALMSSVRGPAHIGGLCGTFHAGVIEKNAFTGEVIRTGADAPTGLLVGSLHSGARMRFCAGCGEVFPFPGSAAGRAAGGVFSASSVVGCAVGPPDHRAIMRLAEALAAGNTIRNTNSQHIIP